MNNKLFEQEKELIKLKEESQLRIIDAQRKLETLKHDYALQQIRLRTANERHLMLEKNELIKKNLKKGGE